MNETHASSPRAEPFSASQVVAARMDFAELQLGANGLFWNEYRPEDAACRIWHWRDGVAKCLTPDGFSVRSRVYEYGGGAFCLTPDGVVFVAEADQQLYRQKLGGEPQALTSGECRAEFERCGVGRVAFVGHGLPHIVPMRFSYDGSDLYGFSMLGEKIECMRENPIVCVEFDNQTNHFHWRSVIATGIYEELPESPANVDVRQYALEVLQKHAMWWQPATVAPRDAFVPILFRIRITRLTGRQAKPDPVEAAQLRERKTTVRSGLIRRILSEIVRPSNSSAGRHRH